MTLDISMFFFTAAREFSDTNCPVQPPPGFFESRVHEGPDEAGLLPSLSRPGLRQTLLQLLLQRHEGLPGQPSRPGPRVAKPYR